MRKESEVKIWGGKQKAKKKHKKPRLAHKLHPVPCHSETQNNEKIIIVLPKDKTMV